MVVDVIMRVIALVKIFISSLINPTDFTFAKTGSFVAKPINVKGNLYIVESIEYVYQMYYRFMYIPPTTYYVYYVTLRGNGKRIHGIYPLPISRLRRWASTDAHEFVIRMHLSTHDHKL